ncbi:MAG: hypothetical protein P1U68_05575 [Verrucomicrobiales bacterium]|nr:hypothetical protein [Verrucomicrobiales bacterium]
MTSRSLVILLFSAWLISASANQANEPAFYTVEGEWGKLQCYDVVIAPPAATLWESLYEERSLWPFEGLSRIEVDELFAELGFSPETIATISNDSSWNKTTAELEVGDRAIEALSPTDRTAIFTWWETQFPGYIDRLVINFEDRNLTAIAKELPREMMDKLQRVIFYRGEVTSTLDRPYLLRQLKTREEKEHLLRTILTTHALIVRLEVDPDSEADSIIKYWEAGGLNPRVRVLIEGLYTTEGVDHLDILHLLPLMPRKYLNNFTVLQDVNPHNTPDCFWTSTQFFNFNTSSRSFDSLPVEHFLDKDYEEISGPLQFGDLVCLFDKDTKEFIHSYTHIAGDLVFTKNGGSFLRPWVISTKAFMLSLYTDNSGLITKIFRRKLGS